MLPKLTVDLVARLLYLVEARTTHRRVSFDRGVHLHLGLALDKAYAFILRAIVALARLLRLIHGARLHVALRLAIQALIAALACSVDLLLLHLLLQAAHRHAVAGRALDGHGRTAALLATQVDCV